MESQRLVPNLIFQSSRKSFQTCIHLPVHPLILPSYSPVGRGMLTGQIKSLADLPQTDRRRILPRFSPENFDTNLKLVNELEKIAKRKDCTPAQLALAWVRSLSKKDGMPTIIPIPGSTTAARVKENAVEVELNDADIRDINTTLAECKVVGDRYQPEFMRMADG